MPKKRLGGILGFQENTSPPPLIGVDLIIRKECLDGAGFVRFVAESVGRGWVTRMRIDRD